MADPTAPGKKAAAARRGRQLKKPGRAAKHKGAAEPGAAPARRRRRRSGLGGGAGGAGGAGAGAGAAGSPRGLPERKVLAGDGGREVWAASALRRPPPRAATKMPFQ